jgi:hypothetical protein
MNRTVRKYPQDEEDFKTISVQWFSSIWRSYYKVADKSLEQYLNNFLLINTSQRLFDIPSDAELNGLYSYKKYLKIISYR